MKAALVQGPGATPVYADFTEPATRSDLDRVTVIASALSQVTRSRATGAHYSASGAYPLIPGIDGTGWLEDGRQVYFILPEAPYGGMAEYCVVNPSHCIPLPAGLDAITAAAIANPGMSSWAALVERAKLRSGETVLINGATGIAGQLAVQIAKYLGAGKVIATGRNAPALQALAALGADVTISLEQDAAVLDHLFQVEFQAGVDVVLDYLWGSSAEQLLISGARAGSDTGPIRYVQIGAVSSANITLPSAVLRSTAIELMGSGIGSIAMPRLFDAIEHVLKSTMSGSFKIATRAVPLCDIEQHWNDPGSRCRTVFVTGVQS